MTTTAERDDLKRLIEARDAAKSGRGRRLRQAAGLSQAELAAACGVTPACIARWELGDRRPGGRGALAYSEALRRIAEEIAGR